MNDERFQELIRLTKTIPPENFNMSCWGVKSECGTVACIAGHASLHPLFIEQGLGHQWIKRGGEELLKPSPEHYPERNIWKGSIEVMAQFFDISVADSRFLFTSAKAMSVQTSEQAVVWLQTWYDQKCLEENTRIMNTFTKSRLLPQKL